MSKAVAITRTALAEARRRQAEALSSVIVLGCGAALILAGQALPF
ncbi:hypothetical protein NAP1_13778 [Erythrobacter sp. NAP1]|nr:hypothetical protein [Erythrobacter sp. NAP1]EAQ28673.1 hypothetical protein NAP1_13778 [Erythrobacter sp. NAP1]